MEQISKEKSKNNWLTKNIILGLLVALIGIGLMAYHCISYIILLINTKDWSNFKETYGTITAIEQDAVKVEYSANGRSYQSKINYINATEDDINDFIHFLYNKNNPTDITFTDYGYVFKDIVIFGVLLIIGILVIKHILQKRYALAKSSHREQAELIGIDKRSLVYYKKSDSTERKNIYYSVPLFYENDYKKLIANNKTSGTLIIAENNPNWWSLDYSEIEGALK